MQMSSTIDWVVLTASTSEVVVMEEVMMVGGRGRGGYETVVQVGV